MQTGKGEARVKWFVRLSLACMQPSQGHMSAEGALYTQEHHTTALPAGASPSSSVGIAKTHLWVVCRCEVGIDPKQVQELLHDASRKLQTSV
jgi:hypothetical protein